MQDVSIHLRGVGIIGCLDSLLQDCSANAGEGVCNDCRGYEMIWMQDEHVVFIVDDAVSCFVELAENMDI